MTRKLLNLREQLSFYKRYHHNKVNVAIHSIFVPTILISSCMLLNRYKIGSGWTLANIFGIAYSVYYISLNYAVGALASLLIYLINYGINEWQTDLKFEAGVFCLSWMFQFIGHGVFEGKKPALLDNLVQNLVLAPYFILFELLFVLGLYKNLNIQLKNDLEKTKNI